MLIDKLNLNHLRIFESVYRTHSMTLAASELHLTQSGVSQHIRSFEEVLGVKLFDRIKQKLVPTAQATLLFKQTAEGLYGIEKVLTEFKGGEKRLTGTVTIGMPVEFGTNIIIPMLSKFGRQHPNLKFSLRLDFASQLNNPMLEGDVDFSFVDEFTLDKRITTERVYDEKLELCISKDLLKKFGPAQNTRKYFETLDYVEYQKGEPILRMWFAHHLASRNLNLNVKAQVMDAQGVARFILCGLGAGILPSHLLTKLQKEGTKLHCYKGSERALRNTISIAYLEERTHSSAVRASIEFLRKELGTLETRI